MLVRKLLSKQCPKVELGQIDIDVNQRPTQSIWVTQEKDIGTNSEHRPTGVQKGKKVENFACANKHD